MSEEEIEEIIERYIPQKRKKRESDDTDLFIAMYPRYPPESSPPVRN